MKRLAAVALLVAASCAPAERSIEISTPATSASSASSSTTTTSSTSSTTTTAPPRPPATRASRSRARPSIDVGKPEPPAAGVRLSSTAYCLTGRMANGERAHLGAVASNRWPLGTVLEVSAGPAGAGRYTVEDRIGWGSELDFAIPGDCDAARRWGRRIVVARPL